MNGMANINPAGRSHYVSAIPVPRAMAHSKPHVAAPPSTPGLPVPHGAPSPQPEKVLAPGPKTLKSKGAGRSAGREPSEGSPGIPPCGGQKAPARPLAFPRKWPGAAAVGRRGAGGVGEPTELPKAPPAQGRGGGQPGGSPGTGSRATMSPRLQEDQEETDMSLGDKCPGPAEGPDPEPKPRGLNPESQRKRTVQNVLDLRQNLEETMSSLRGSQVSHR
ncbi:uncharacterized protein ENSP00000471857-like [Egretta garzetta]|uniref:uncharacterized protein ENSP00000471857-like n=1 Tax=Egretta garzetta TaxID=188379 RepID=UPI00163CE1F6|nr:uncharacterized protein ENSP00000471857-like [Egretta garzetta]